MAKPTRAAPPSLSARVARNEIVGAAVSVFSRMGFVDTRVEDVIEAAGISRRTFYKYFANKDDVLAAVYDFATTELAAAIGHVATSSEDPLEALHAGVDLYLDFFVQNAMLVRVLVEQAVRSDSPLYPLRKRFRAQLAELAAKASAARGRDDIDPYVYVAIVSALEGLSLELLDGEGAKPHEIDRAKHVVHTLLDQMLGARRSPAHHGAR
jgi:AcrR family transcriptional regulator